ncbi:nucleotidyltransferase family protein [uncultured Ruminococcus sp.]|uniref:nucleotidyltransferase domain-containing protein n=1 Tax=uncultured Ruminococcus sp. TaxID=165186 RepID=UPI0026248110|nr:nucleotidyltransferase family protein [uncultured Ruminococcus sp.]
MIDRSQQVLLEAIKASLFNFKPTYPDDTDWDSVIKEAKAQAVIGLISPVIPVHDESSDQGIAYYMRLLHEQDKLLKLLEANNISCVILKGCTAAMYYPKPYLRSMGDVDFLVRQDQFDDAIGLMESNGYVCIEGKGEDGRLKKGDRHLGYSKNGIEFELHHHFSSAGFDIDDILEKAIDKRECRKLNGYSFPVLPEVENGLVLLGHINQHLKRDNLGLRQIIDWEMYCYSVMRKEESKIEFISIAKEIGLLKLAVNVTRMCEKYLGLSESLISTGAIRKNKRNDSAEEEIVDKLLENLLTYGNFGIKQVSSSEKSGDSIRSVIGNIKHQGFYTCFQEYGMDTWKLSKKYPVLKPFAFIYGVFRIVVRGIVSIIKTGEFKEQIRYVKDNNKYDRELGIRTKDNKQ